MAEPNGATAGPMRVSVENDRDSIERTESEILSRLESLGYPRASIFAIKLAMEEALTNAFKHGHADVEGDPPVIVEYSLDDAQVVIRIEDHGPGFDVNTIPDPTLDENLTVPSGRGLMLIRSYMTSVVHNKKGNLVELIYRKPRRDRC